MAKQYLKMACFVSRFHNWVGDFSCFFSVFLTCLWFGMQKWEDLNMKKNILIASWSLACIKNTIQKTLKLFLLRYKIKFCHSVPFYYSYLFALLLLIDDSWPWKAVYNENNTKHCLLKSFSGQCFSWYILAKEPSHISWFLNLLPTWLISGSFYI